MLCLLVGNILLATIAASSPMYTKAALQRQLTTSLKEYVQLKGAYPTTVYIFASGIGAKGLENIQSAESMLYTLPEDLGIPAEQFIINLYLDETRLEAERKIGRDSSVKTVRLGILEDIEEHIDIIAGSMYSGISDDGVLEAIISEKCLMDMKLLLGETFTVPDFTDVDGNPLRVRITGVFKNSRDDDIYWHKPPSEYYRDIFIAPEIFRDYFMQADNYPNTLRALTFMIFDYNAVTVDNAQSVAAIASEYQQTVKSINGVSYRDYFSVILDDYLIGVPRITTTLRILQIPIYALLAAFIFMVSRQMLEQERNEISVFKSRGATKKQIITIYLVQSIIVAIASFVFALPLSVLCCQIIGSANSFLEFVARQSLRLEITAEVLCYCFAALLFSIIVMVLPVFKFAEVSIVNTKRARSRSQIPIWQKLFIDIIMLAVSIYGLYSFSTQKDVIAQRVAEGAGLDPLLFLCSSLFIIGAGLTMLRIIPLIISFIYLCGKRYWNPSIYTSLLWVRRTRHSQGYIIVFLIVTIAMGVFNAQSARTINGNEEDRIRYLGGADIVLAEPWKDNREQVNDDDTGLIRLSYEEPDFAKYTTLDGVRNITKVLVDSNSLIQLELSNRVNGVTVMGIDTKQFGEIASFNTELIPGHWYDYLNAISQTPSAVLVSSNLRDDYDFKLGDTITYYNSDRQNIRGTIFGFVDYWPAYNPETESVAQDGTVKIIDNYLVIANLGYLQSKWGITPYQIWIQADNTTSFIYEFAAEQNIVFSVFRDSKAAIIEMKNDPTIQGTNGILTVGFVVTLIFCSVGFLIYWILSINSRVLQFGIFRAMGVTMKEIIAMLFCEQICISGLSIICGFAVGSLSSVLFIPLVQLAYAPMDTVIPLQMLSETSDMLRLLLVVGAVIAVCMLILARLISKIKISQALKLGED